MSSSFAERLRPWWSLSIPDQVATESSRRRGRTMLWWALAFALAFAAVYIVFVWTRNGQRWDDAAWYGYKIQDGDFLLAAKEQLRQISLPSLVIASAVLCVIAWARWGLRAGVVVGLFLVITLGVAEVLKHWILPRPEFYDFDPLAKAHNTLPSGHTTIGAMVAVGFVLVLPRQIRGLAVIVAFLFAASIGGSTLAAGWHRPSDAIAAYLYVGFATCVVIALMLRRGSARLLTREQLGPLRGWSIVVWVVPLVTVLILVGAVSATAQEWPLVSGTVALTEWTNPQRDRAFTAGLLADYAAAGVVFTLLYLVLRRVELGVPREEWRKWSRRVSAQTAAVAEGETDDVNAVPAVPEPGPVNPLANVTLLPEITRDESGEGWGDERTEQDYLRERPPHHGD